ncbi:hypothetical protein WA026_019362, partial [Henosepilachna vigintioctopunctata]
MRFISKCLSNIHSHNLQVSARTNNGENDFHFMHSTFILKVAGEKKDIKERNLGVQAYTRFYLCFYFGGKGSHPSPRRVAQYSGARIRCG